MRQAAYTKLIHLWLTNIGTIAKTCWAAEDWITKTKKARVQLGEMVLVGTPCLHQQEAPLLDPLFKLAFGFGSCYLA